MGVNQKGEILVLDLNIPTSLNGIEHHIKGHFLISPFCDVFPQMINVPNTTSCERLSSPYLPTMSTFCQELLDHFVLKINEFFSDNDSKYSMKLKHIFQDIIVGRIGGPPDNILLRGYYWLNFIEGLEENTILTFITSDKAIARLLTLVDNCHIIFVDEEREYEREERPAVGDRNYNMFNLILSIFKRTMKSSEEYVELTEFVLVSKFHPRFWLDFRLPSAYDRYFDGIYQTSAVNMIVAVPRRFQRAARQTFREMEDKQVKLIFLDCSLKKKMRAIVDIIRIKSLFRRFIRSVENPLEKKIISEFINAHCFSRLEDFLEDIEFSEKISAIAIASDSEMMMLHHPMMARSLARLTREGKTKIIEYQHGVLGEGLPALHRTKLMLNNMSFPDYYATWGPRFSNIFNSVSGCRAIEVGRCSRSIQSDSKLEFVCDVLVTPSQFSIYGMLYVVELLSRRMAGIIVGVKMHPSHGVIKASNTLPRLFQRDNVFLLNPKISIEGAIANSKVVIAANSVIFDSLSNGKPVIVPKHLSRIEFLPNLESREHLVIVHDDDELINAVQHLIKSPPIESNHVPAWLNDFIIDFNIEHLCPILELFNDQNR